MVSAPLGVTAKLPRNVLSKTTFTGPPTVVSAFTVALVNVSARLPTVSLPGPFRVLDERDRATVSVVKFGVKFATELEKSTLPEPIKLPVVL